MTTTRGLLGALGLTSPAGSVTGGGSKPTGATGPTAPLKPPKYNPPQELPAAKKKGLDDAEFAKALKSLPSDPPKRAEALADLVTKVSDEARRDPVVKALRNVIVKIQPVMLDAEAKKALDKAIGDLIDKGIKEGIMALLKAVAGKAPTAVDSDAPPKYGPDIPEKDLGEKILKTPELPLPFDKPPKLHRNSFEFVGLAKSYEVSKYFDFKVRTPDWFEPYGQMGAGRVVIASKANYDKSKGRSLSERVKQIEKKGEVPMSLAAPDKPGEYVLFIIVGLDAESHAAENIDVVK